MASSRCLKIVVSLLKILPNLDGELGVVIIPLGQWVDPTAFLQLGKRVRAIKKSLIVGIGC